MIYYLNLRTTYFKVCNKGLASLLLFVLLLFGSMDTFAAKEWEGDVSSDWNNANNWQGNTFPGSGDDVIIDASVYTNAPIISANSIFSIKKLKVIEGGVLTIQANLTCNDQVEVDGDHGPSAINMSGGKLQIKNGKDFIVKRNGTINLTGGDIEITGFLNLEDGSVFNMDESSDDASVTVEEYLILLADDGSCELNIDGGDFSVTDYVQLDANNKSPQHCNITVTGGTFTNDGPTWFERNNDDDITVLTVSGGEVTLVGDVSDNGNGRIQIDVSGGSLTFEGDLTMEVEDNFTQSGGTITFDGDDQVWESDCNFNSTAGTVVFHDKDDRELLGTGSWNFFNVTISGDMSQVDPANINVRGNWISTGTFNENTHTVTFDGTGVQTVEEKTFYRMRVNKSSGYISLSDDLTVSNRLTMSQGNIDANNKVITLGTGTGNTGTLSHSSGTIIGQFERWINSTGSSILYPVGTATLYMPNNLTFTNLTPGSLVMEFVAGDPGSDGLPLAESYISITNPFTEGYWDLDPQNSLQSTNYEVSVLSDNFSSYPIDSYTRLIKRAPGDDWTAEGTHNIAGSYIERSGLNGAEAQFALGHTACMNPDAEVNHSITTPVIQAMPDNEILQIKVYSFGSVCLNTISAFDFNTGGNPGSDDPANDISNAKVYYTANSPVFSTGTLFGSLGSAPNGNFTISGSQTMPEDTVYFWLTYDITTTATPDNLVDAQLISFDVEDSTVTVISNKNPAGSRIIKEDRYAVATDDWNKTSTWSYYSGGPPGAPVPTSTTNAYIEGGYTVTVNSSGEIARSINILSDASTAKLTITTGGSLTADTIYMTTTAAKAELHLDNNGQLTVNNGVNINTSGATVDGNQTILVADNAQLTLNGNLDLVNSSNYELGFYMQDNALLTMNADINFSGSIADKTFLTMDDNAQMDLAGSLNIVGGQRGKLYNPDGLHNSVINFVGSATQVIELTPNASNSSKWEYSTVWINNAAGVTLNANVTDGPDYSTIQKALVVQSGVLNTGGYSIQLVNDNNSLFEVQDGATFYTTSTDSYGGMPYFGSNQGNGQITLGTTSTVIFAAPGNQAVPGLTGTNGSSYGDVTFSGSGIKTLTNAHHANFSANTGNIAVEGNLLIEDGVNLDAGTNNYSIFTKGNWTDQNSVSNAGFNGRSGAVIFQGSATQTITFSALQTFAGLTVNKSSGELDLANDVVISEELTMIQGNINPGINVLTLGTGVGNTGSISYASGIILGKFERWANATGSDYLFPVGIVSDYRPANINFSNLTNGSLIVEFIATDPASNGLPLAENAVMVANQFTEGYWDLTAANSLASSDYDVNITGNGFTSYPVDTRTRVVKRVASDSLWILDGTPVTASGMTANRNALNGINTAQFAFATAACTGSYTTSTTGTDANCFGASDGTVDLTVSGGRSPYVYNWSHGDTTEDLAAVSAGTYYVTITDADLCTETDSFVVGEPAGMVTGITVTSDYNGYDVSCFGYADGAADLTVSDGTPPYTYNWSSGETIQDPVNLTGGNNVVTVTDDQGCSITDSISLTEPTEILLSTTQVDISCSGDSSGSIDLTVSGGLAPYTYSWSNSDTTEDIAGLPVGAYFVTVTDTQGCFAVNGDTLVLIPVMTLSTTKTDACDGGGSGSIDLTISGGKAPYTYSWSNADTTEDIYGLFAGIYTVTVTDDDGCTETATDTVIASASMSTSIVSTDPSIYGASDGSADLTVSGGTSPYTYLWSDSVTSEDRTGINAGLYIVTITDAFGCVAMDTTTLINPTTAQPYCEAFNYTDGTTSSSDWSITCASCVLSGSDHFEVRSNQFEANNLDGTGIWTSGLIDITGMTNQTWSVNLSESGDLESNDYIRVYYILDGGAETLFDTNGNMTDDFGSVTASQAGLVGSTLEIVIKVYNDNSTETHRFDDVCVSGDIILTMTGEVTNAACNTCPTGSVDITVTGGTGPMSYLWSTGDTTQDLTNMEPGIYSITVTDINGDTVMASFEIYGITFSCDQQEVHYLPPVYGEGTGNSNYYGTHDLVLSTEYSSASVNISTADGSYSLDTILSSSSPQIITLPVTPATMVVQSTGLNTVENDKGLIITSDVKVQASYRITSTFNQDIAILKGNTALGYNFYCASQTRLAASSNSYERHFISVIATEDNTEVTIQSTQPLEGVTGSTPTINVTLNTGETYLVTTKNGQNVSITGSHVTSDKPVAVISGSQHNSQPYNGNRDAGFDQIVPTDILGDEYIAVTSPNSNANSNYVVVVAVEDNTTFYVDGSAITTLNAGQWTDYALSGASTGYRISFSKPAYAYHVTAHAAHEYGMAILPPINPCIGNLTATFYRTSGSSNDGAFVLIPTTGLSSLEFRGAPYTTYGTASAITGTSYSAVVFPNSSIASAGTPNDVSADERFHLGVTSNTGTDATGNYGYYSDYEPSIDILSPVDGLPTSRYLAENVVPGIPKNHCIDMSSCGSSHSVIGVVKGSETKSVTYSGNCIEYTMLETSAPCQSDTITVLVENEFGFKNAVCLSFYAENAATTTPNSVSCHGGSDGSIDMIVTAGIPPFTYIWSSGDTTEDISGKSAGYYSVTVSDANGCAAETGDTIDEPTELLESITIANVICLGDSNGSIDLSISGGVAPYSYIWSNGETTQDISGLTAGAYQVTITDNNVCAITVSDTIITDPQPLSISTSIVDVSCNGGSDGSIDLVVNDGASPYGYLWSNAATTQDISGLVIGVYSVTVTDANGCDAVTISDTLTQPSAINASTTPINLLCNGDADGSIDLTVGGGIAPYSYSWSNAETTEDITGLTVGPYNVTVTDAQSCTMTTGISITQPAALTASTALTHISCNGGSDGSIDLSVGGGTSPYAYNWSNADTTEDISGLSMGTYNVTATDANNCTVNSGATITEPTVPTISSIWRK